MVIKYCICGTATLPEHPSSSTGFNWVLVIKFLVFCVLYCRSLFSLSSLCVLMYSPFVFDIRFLITHMVSSFVYGRITTGIYIYSLGNSLYHFSIKCTLKILMTMLQYYNACLTIYTYINLSRSRRGGDRMVFRFTTTYAISAYHY